MTNLKYRLVQSDEKGALTAFVNGNLYSVTNSHSNWKQILDAVQNAGSNPNEVAIARLFDPQTAANAFFKKVSDRVSVKDGKVYFDSEEVNDGLTAHIIRFMSDGEDAMPLVNFLEKIQLNPSENSRTQLYDWLSKRDFTITPEGNFLAYKGVRANTSGVAKYPYESISTGTAIVDGQTYQGAIPNGVGAVVEMPRSDVADNPNVACHTGLHAGNYRYASNFGETVLIVEINPRDVVSVPHDSNSEKIRCCRYTVKEVKNAEFTTSYYGGYSKPLDEDYSDDAPYEGDEDDSWY